MVARLQKGQTLQPHGRLGSVYCCVGQGLDHVIFVTALEGKLLLRQYVIALKKSGTRVPRVELQEMGPSLDLSLRRVREAPPDLMAEALRQPKTTGKKASFLANFYRPLAHRKASRRSASYSNPGSGSADPACIRSVLEHAAASLNGV